MALRPPEPGSFETLLREVRIPVSNLIRLSRRPTSEPYWSVGIHRFDDPQIEPDGRFGVTYAAASLDVAFAETIIHESSRFVKQRYEVPEAELMGRHVVRFERPGRPVLVLADLCGSALKELGLNNDLSATDDYTLPQRWSRAIHEASTKWDGIRYVSRQRNDAHAYAIFERSGLRKKGSMPLAGARLDALCDQYRVVAI